MTSQLVGIVDYGMGNLRSVMNAVTEVGFNVKVVDSSYGMEDLSHLILPGVGNFGSAMDVLKVTGLLNSLIDFQKSGRPLLGICLGMQLLAESGSEGGGHTGLKMVPGRVSKLTEKPGFRAPHVGWNTLKLLIKHPVFEGLKPGRDVYFVHSYEFQCEDLAHQLAVTEYGTSITAAVGSANVIGFQFHPEKSQISGLRLIENFCLWDGRC